MLHFNKTERSLLLYLETCAVDDYGRVDARKINAEEMKIMDKWKKDGYIDYGRIKFKDIRASKPLWVVLSDDAWRDVHILREERAKRMWKNKKFSTTDGM